ncbi:transposase [Streptomyces sp. NPDC051207]|uniref:IS110 family transposase n=1 Tax=Streptomyces sp. NPDC051207 TaxID=3154641 RepID=UPI0034367263
MTAPEIAVIGGIDTHTDIHQAAVIDSIGRHLDMQPFETNSAGHEQLLAWLRAQRDVIAVGMEGTGAYGAELARFLTANGITVVEVDRPDRKARWAHGKSDPIDAYAAATAVLSGRASGTPKSRDGIVEAIRALWAALADGRVPANVCVDACMTLRNAYGQLGVQAELLAVDLAVEHENGGGTRYGSLTPSWTGTSWSGHCVLVLPGSERFVDATVEQFDEVREVGAGPMIGKVALSTHDNGSLVEPGAQVMLQRATWCVCTLLPGPTR